MLLARGTIIAITYGEYSDYTLGGHFRVLKQFDTQEAIATFKSCDEYPSNYYERRDAFLAWVIRQGLIEPFAEAVEWYLGDYGDLGDDP